ncbi:Hypothetical Protein FCC1311_112452 [Hondaea fermentalgiana]|uniref:Uncharacterized protein n=1 Tax=Hondaea fermentalgiana TaxID=2315210 RepID=A0A2R5GW04_9STRA|nr:Hypothetical Protein FCC1311_112452 [Hondaea fermentalgiana]|eukprot:GBG35022.1 Hypothetical Protein FCC1311_112452 [Hondaea fermentalgiana]
MAGSSRAASAYAIGATIVAVVAAVAHAQTDSCTTGELDTLTWGNFTNPGCGSVSFDMGGCCGNALESTTEAVCSTTLIESAYCDTDVISGGCSGFTPNASDSAIFEISITYAETEDTCCQKCKCYGDPLCEAFDGTRDQLIECDARNFTTCGLQQDICRQQYDHAGNRCKWLKGNLNYPWWTSNLESGSPCQADYNVSGQLELVMLDVDDMSISSLVGERGVQTDAMILLPSYSEPFQINSDTCFDYDPRDVGTDGAAAAWQLPSSASSIPSTWSVTIPDDVSIHWHVGDESLGIYAEVICTKAINATRSRLDIENVTDTQGRTSGDGFCFTGSIDSEQLSGSNVDNPEGHYNCLSKTLPDLVNTCKALTDDTCYQRSVSGWQQYWCETAELQYTQASSEASTYEAMVSACLSDIRSGTEDEQAETWVTYACQMNSQEEYDSSAQSSYVDECVNKMDEFGWYEWLQTYQGIIEHSWTVSETCVSSLDDFTTIPDDETCASGLMVETNQNGTWVPILYFPPESPPCSDADLEATGETFPALFQYQVRFRQCGLDASCLVAEGGTSCKPVMDISATVTFSGQACAPEDDILITSTGNCSCSLDSGSDTSVPQVCTSDSEATYPLGTCGQCCETNNYIPGQEGQACRAIETTTPFCNTTDSATSAYCTKLQKKSYNATMLLNFGTPASGFDSYCCESCQLWGDPFGQAFDGSREKLIVCDARDEDCDTLESVCDTLVDHAGNPCVWNQTVADLIGNRGANIAAYGSPCLPDWEASGEDEIVLYTVDEPTFSLSFYTGERSILDKLLLTTSKGSYTLDPVACYADDPLDGWTTVSGEDVSTALNLTYTGAGEDGYGNDERVWAVLVQDMGIFFRVTCVNSQAVDADYVGGYRLNVEHLIDTDLERSGTGGYCVTADLYEYGGSYTNNSFAIECETKDLSASHRACKAFWAGSCTPDQIDLGIENWCEIANQPYTVSKCVSKITKSTAKKTAAAWTKAVCTALLPMKQATESDSDFLTACEDLGETDGYYSIVENYGSAGDRGSVSSYCASSVSEYGSRDETDACIVGVSVQYDAGDGWEELFFIPSNLLPCNGELLIPAYDSTYWPLFAYPIRFEQCDVLDEDGACPSSTNVEATCMSNFGFNVSMTYNYNDVGCDNSS